MASYLSLISPASNGEFNIKLAKLAGLQTAVYWAVLLEVLERVRDKQTYNPDGFFTLNREYVTSKTTLTESEQLDCDNILKKLDLLCTGPETNSVRLDLINYTKIILDDDPTHLTATKKVSKAASKSGKAEGKRTGILHTLNSVTSAESESVQKAFSEWIEVVYEKGICKKAQAQLALNTVNQFTSDDKVKIAVLNIGTTSGYRELEWAINKYKTISASMPQQQQVKCTMTDLAQETF